MCVCVCVCVCARFGMKSDGNEKKDSLKNEIDMFHL